MTQFYDVLLQAQAKENQQLSPIAGPPNFSPAGSHLLREGAVPKGGWDSVAILGSHEQPNQPQSGTWSPHLQPKRQPQSRSHSPHDLLGRKTSAATTGCAKFTPRLLSQPVGLQTAETVRKVEELRLLFFSLNHSVVVRRRGMPSKDRFFRLTPFGLLLTLLWQVDHPQTNAGCLRCHCSQASR